MSHPRTKALPTFALAVCLLLLAVLAALLATGSAPAQALAPAGSGLEQHPLSAPQAAIDYPVKFVGQDHVDIKWELIPDSWWTSYLIQRDGALLKRFDTTVTFYRDGAVSKGQTYEYYVCAQHLEEAPMCGLSSTATVGQIRGLLYEYLSWSGDVYQISGEVTVQPGATLHMGYGATVAGAWDAEIRDFDPDGGDLGTIQADGATIRGRLVLKSSSSWVTASTIGGDAPGYIDLDGWSGDAFSGNTFTSTGRLTIYSRAGQETQVHDNTFYAAWLNASGAGKVRIHGNRFEKGSAVRVEGTVGGSISGNNLYDSSILVNSTGYFDIENNRMRCLDLSCGTLIGVSASAPNVGIYGNLLDGFLNGAYGTGTGISAGADQDAGGIVDIHDNVITELEKGISLAGPIRALIYNNTITHNRTGILAHHWPTIDDPAVAATGNCISGNLRSANTAHAGLTTVGISTTVEATGNYWGDPLGPTHPDNPDGHGDRIQELDMDWGPVPIPGVVNFEGWLSNHHCSETDLSVGGLEVVQSIQDLNNSVPLVAGKSTWVRIYADSGMAPEVTGVPVELQVLRDGSLLGTKQGTLTARPIVQWDQVRAATDTGWIVRFDEKWLTGTVTLKVTLNSGGSIEELSPDNNMVTRTLAFTERRPLLIGLVPIEYRPLPTVDSRTPLTDELPSLVSFLHKAYPVSNVQVRLLPSLYWPYMMKSSESEVPRKRRLLNELTLMWSLDRMSIAEAGEDLDQIVGVFPSDCEAGGDITFSTSDPRWLGGKGRASYMCNNSGNLLAHEVGHNLGLYHPCNPTQAAMCDGAQHPGPPTAPPQDWPYANASIQEYGFDAIEKAIILPVTADLMTYWKPRWLSPHNYGKLFKADGEPQPPAAAVPTGTTLQATAASLYLLAGGLVDTGGGVSFDPFWQVTAAEPPLSPPGGSSYCLEVQDAASAVLHSQCFDLVFFDYEAGEASPIDAFLTALPLAPGAGRVVLKQGAVVLGQVAASAHAPQVTLLSPNTTGIKGGRIPIRWTASDADPGSELAFNLFYSHNNGATWQPFALNVTGTQELELDLSNVPGGAACRVKVDISDGWHHASDASDASFPVADKAPLAGILWPEDGATVRPPLALQGYGYDLEDGQRAGTALTWSSDLDGALGSGDTVWDVDLTPGVHTLTLRVIDSKNHTGSASVVVTVVGGLPGGERVYLPIVLRQH